ncbi:MAG: hypothetical protein AABY00_00590 [Nanoarchaeota archaeon]
MKWTKRQVINKGLLLFSLTCFSPLASQLVLGIVNTYTQRCGQKIEGPLEMKVMFERERAKQNISPDKKIGFIWDIQTPGKSGTMRVAHNNYIVLFRKGSNNSAVVEHEFYHISDGHCDKRSYGSFLNNLRYWLVNEPQATLYTATGIRL